MHFSFCVRVCHNESLAYKSGKEFLPLAESPHSASLVLTERSLLPSSLHHSK